MQTIKPYVYFNKEIVPKEQATVGIASHSLQYGSTCFGGVRGYWKDGEVRVFRLKDHWERLMDSSRTLEFGYHIPFEQFETVISELIERNQIDSNIYLRPFLFTRHEKLAPRFEGLEFDLGIYILEFGDYFDPSRGLKLKISNWRKISDAAMPTKAKAGGCYVNSSLAANDAVRDGYDDALLMDEQGYIVEASVANIIMVHRGRVVMPDFGSPMLEGITLRTAIDFLKEEGIPVHFERIDRSMIYLADELMVTGTAAMVRSVESVDGRPIRGTAICEMLKKKFDQVLSLEHPKSDEWLYRFSQQTGQSTCR